MKECKHCGENLDSAHQEDHPGICCDCFDMSFGMPLAEINKGRAVKGKPPLTKPWPQEAT